MAADDDTACLTNTHQQVFDDQKVAGRLVNRGLEKVSAIGAGLGDKMNENADMIVEKVRAKEVGAIRGM